MSFLSKVGQWLKDHSRWLWRAGGLMLLALVVAMVMSSIWTATPTDKDVVAEWNETIRRLGIEPVFPPEEDIYVGDLFAVITADRRPENKDTQRQPLLNRAIKYVDNLFAADSRPESKDTQRQPLLNRAIKLAHIDMTSDLKK